MFAASLNQWNLTPLAKSKAFVIWLGDLRGVLNSEDFTAFQMFPSQSGLSLCQVWCVVKSLSVNTVVFVSTWIPKNIDC